MTQEFLALLEKMHAQMVLAFVTPTMIELTQWEKLLKVALQVEEMLQSRANLEEFQEIWTQEELKQLGKLCKAILYGTLCSEMSREIHSQIPFVAKLWMEPA